MSDMKIIDKDGKWFVQTGAFRLPHALRPEVIFEPGVKMRVKSDDWIEGQSGTLHLTNMDEDVEGKIQQPEQPKLPRVDRNQPDKA